MFERIIQLICGVATAMVCCEGEPYHIMFIRNNTMDLYNSYNPESDDKTDRKFLTDCFTKSPSPNGK